MYVSDTHFPVVLVAANEPLYIDRGVGNDSQVRNIFVQEAMRYAAHRHYNGRISCSPAPRHHQLYPRTMSTVIHGSVYLDKVQMEIL